MANAARPTWRSGLTPCRDVSQAVHAPYESVTESKSRSNKALDAILERDSGRAAVAEKQQKLESIRKVQDFVRAMGITGGGATPASFADATADKDMLEEAIFDHCAQKEAIA